MRAVLSYVILVGLPLFGIFAVIEKGKALQPPVSVAGDWRAEMEEDPASCMSGRVGPSFTLRMDQSGSHLSLFLKEGAAAVMEGKILRSRISARTKDDSMELKAEVQKRAEGDRLLGSLSLKECAERGPFTLSAVKSVPTKPIALGGR